MEGIKKPDAGGTRQEQKEHGKDNIFQPIGRNCSLTKLAEKYYTGFGEFCHENPPDTPISFLREAWDMIFESIHLVNAEGGKQWKI